MSSTGLVGSSAVMAAGTVVSRLLGFVRSAVFVFALGSQLTGDTYTVANTVPNIVYILLLGGALNAVFVPQLVRGMKSHSDGGKAYADGLLTMTGVALVVLTLVATAAAPLLVRLYSGSSWTAADREVSIQFAYWCLPQILFYGIYTMLGQVLNARGRFGPMMWAPILNNIVAIAAATAFLVAGQVDKTDPSTISSGWIAWLGIGSTLGVAAQAIILVPFVRATGYHYTPRWDVRGLGLRKAADLARWTLGFVAVNQVAFLVVTRVATGLSREAVTAGLGYGVGITPYQNAYLFFMLPHSIVTVSIVTALLPRMSGAAVDGRFRDLVADLSQGLRLSGVAVVPSAVFLGVFGPALLTLLFAYQATSTRDAHYMGLILAGFCVGLVPFTVHHVSLRGFYSFDDTRTPFLIQAVIAAVNIGLIVVVHLTLPLRWETVGLALAFSGSFVVGCALSVATLRRRLGDVDAYRVVRTYVRLAVASGLAGLAAWLVSRPVGWVVDDARLGSLGELVVAAVVMGLGYAWLARRMRVTELTEVLDTVRARLGR